MEGRLLGGQGQSGTDRRRVAGGSFQVNSALCPFQHLVCMQVWLSPRICQDFWHCKLLQQQPQVIFLVGFGPSFNLKCTFLRSFGCFNNGLRVGWVYEVMFVHMLLLNRMSPRSFCNKNFAQGQLGGGYLVGKVDEKGELTGPDIAYIYPDFRFNLVHKWRK